MNWEDLMVAMSDGGLVPALERIAVALESISAVMQASTGYPAELTIDDIHDPVDDTMGRLANGEANDDLIPF